MMSEMPKGGRRKVPGRQVSTQGSQSSRKLGWAGHAHSSWISKSSGGFEVATSTHQKNETQSSRLNKPRII